MLNRSSTGGIAVKQTYTGSCPCQNVHFSLLLPLTLESYQARKCDCDFCMQRNVSYLSDPDGQLDIYSSTPLAKNRQGSEQAVFLSCTHCQTLIAATCPFPAGLKGAINSTLITGQEQLKPAVDVSPKQLNSEEKLRRWRAVWLAVTIN